MQRRLPLPSRAGHWFTGVLTLLALALTITACDKDETDARAAAEREEQATDGPTTATVQCEELELKVTCPPKWRCDADEGIRHTELAAGVELRRSRAESAETLLENERRRRFEEQRTLVEQVEHELGLVQVSERVLDNGARTRSWSLVRAVDGKPIVCTGTTAAVDYPELVEEIEAICTSLELARKPKTADDERAETEASEAPIAIDETPMTDLLVAGAPELPARLARIELGMPRDEVVQTLPELANDTTIIGEFDVRAHYWGPHDGLTGVSFSIPRERITREEFENEAIVAWGEPVRTEDQRTIWTDRASRMQATLEQPNKEDLRLTMRRIQTYADLLGDQPGRLGFEREGAPLIGLSRAELTDHYGDLLYDDDQALALPPLPWGGAIGARPEGDPIEAVELLLDFRRHPPELDAFEAAVTARWGQPRRVRTDAGAALSFEAPDGTRLLLRRSADVAMVTLRLEAPK